MLIFRGRDVSPESLLVPWLAGGAMLLVASLLVLLVRPDPKRIAESIERSLGRSGETPPPAAPLAEILRRPGVITAIIASVVSFAVMASVMNLTGYVMVQHHHHAQHLVFPVIGAHVLACTCSCRGRHAGIVLVAALRWLRVLRCLECLPLG